MNHNWIKHKVKNIYFFLIKKKKKKKKTRWPKAEYLPLPTFILSHAGHRRATWCTFPVSIFHSWKKRSLQYAGYGINWRKQIHYSFLFHAVVCVNNVLEFFKSSLTSRVLNFSEFFWQRANPKTINASNSLGLL